MPMHHPDALRAFGAHGLAEFESLGYRVVHAQESSSESNGNIIVVAKAKYVATHNNGNSQTAREPEALLEKCRNYVAYQSRRGVDVTA